MWDDLQAGRRTEVDYINGELVALAKSRGMSAPANARMVEIGNATGGGSFMREETRRRVHDKAVSIWLKADAEIIMRRVKRRTDRPLLQTTDPAATIAQQYDLGGPAFGRWRAEQGAILERWATFCAIAEQHGPTWDTCL